MVDNRDYWSSANEEGSVKISEDVVAAIAAIEAAETEGVHSLTAGITGEIAQLLGKKSLARGVKVVFDGDNVDLDMYCVIQYGFNIFEVAKNVQTATKSAVESMTGLKLTTANIHVTGIHYDPAPPKADLTKKEDA